MGEVKDVNVTAFLNARIENGIWYGEPFDRPMIITGNFGDPRDNGIGYHTGIDLAPLDGYPGTPIRFKGSNGFFIDWIGLSNGSRQRDLNGGYGNVLLGKTDMGRHKILLAHLAFFSEDILKWLGSGYAPSLKPTFSPDEVVAYQGNSGFVWGYLADGSVGVPPEDDVMSGTHTHLEVRDSNNILLDPRTVLIG